MIRRFRILPIFFLLLLPVFAQQSDPSLLTLDSMFTYRIRPLGPVQWQTDGSGYLALEPSSTKKNFLDIVRYDVNTGDRVDGLCVAKRSRARARLRLPEAHGETDRAGGVDRCDCGSDWTR